MSETKLVHGVLVERRSCACGCGAPLWVKPSSAQVYASRVCSGLTDDPTTPNPWTTPAGTVTGNEMARRLGMCAQRLANLAKQGVIPFTFVPGKSRRCYEPAAVREAYGAYLSTRQRGRRPKNEAAHA